jgi:hypothetical protein
LPSVAALKILIADWLFEAKQSRAASPAPVHHPPGKPRGLL